MKNIVCCLLLLVTFACGGSKAQAQNKMRLISYNILEGMKLDSTKNKQAFATWVKSYNPDILALQECNKFTQLSLEELAHSYGHMYAVLVKTTGYPTAITSKYPIVNAQKITDNMTHGFIMCQIKDINVVVLHLNPHNYIKRHEEIANVLSHIAASPSKKKWLMMGDFNSISPLDAPKYADGKLLAHLKEVAKKNPQHNNLVNGSELDYQVQQQVLNFGFKDSGFLKDTTNQYKGTRIDYIYVSKDMLPAVLSTHFIFDAFTAHYSDHRPVMMDFKQKN